MGSSKLSDYDIEDRMWLGCFSMIMIWLFLIFIMSTFYIFSKYL